jgi:hypothetical protein
VILDVKVCFSGGNVRFKCDQRDYIIVKKEGRVRRIVIDAAIPTKNISIVDVANALYKVDGTKAVRIIVDDVDVDILGLVIVMEGEDIDFREAEKTLEEVGGVIHSIDEVVVGDYVPEKGKEE